MIGDDYRDTRDPRRIWTLLADNIQRNGRRHVVLTLVERPSVVNEWVPWAEFVEHYERIT